MSCLWCCGEEEQSIFFLKVLSKEENVTDKEFAYWAEKSLRELFFCLECQKEYYRLKQKYILNVDSIKNLVCIEHYRLVDNLTKIHHQIIETGKSQNIQYLNPVIEILLHPYLCLERNVFGFFIETLETLIDFMSEDLTSENEFYPTWFLLLFSRKSKIKQWSANCIANFPPIQYNSYKELKPLLNVILTIQTKDLVTKRNPSETSELIFQITADTKLPCFLFDGINMTDVHLACAVLFNSLHSRVVKTMLLEDNQKKFVRLLVQDFTKCATGNIWPQLFLIEVLMKKLEAAFWFLVLCSPSELFSLIINHTSYKSLTQCTVSKPHAPLKANATFCEMVYSCLNINDLSERHISLSFSWILPLLRSTSEDATLQTCLLQQIFKFHLENWARCLPSSLLYLCVSKNLLDVIKYATNVNILHTVAHFNKDVVSIILSLTSNKHFPLLSRGAIDLVNMTVNRSCGKMIITKDLRSVFQSNYKKLQLKISHNEEILTSVLLKVFAGLSVKKEGSECDNSVIKTEANRGSGIVEDPILLDDDVEDVEVLESPLTVSNNEEVTENSAGSQSPICVSDVEDIHDALQGKTFSGDLMHRLMSDEMQNDNVKEDFSTEVTLKKDKYDCSHNIRNVQTMHDKNNTGVVRTPPPRHPCHRLRREKIELSLAEQNNTKVSTCLPNCRTKTPLSILNFQSSILSWNVSLLDGDQEPREQRESSLKAVGINYNEYSDYSNTFYMLMLNEAKADVVKSWRENVDVARDDYVIDCVDEHNTFTKTYHMQCHCCSNVNNMKWPLEDDLVLLVFVCDGEETSVFGIVEKVQIVNKNKSNSHNANMCTLFVKLNAVCNDRHYTRVNITQVMPLTAYIRQFAGVLALRTSLLAPDILKPFRKNVYSSCAEAIPQNACLHKLNSSQFHAVSKISRAVSTEFACPRIVLIQGPPGTGKSYTIKKAITNLLQAFHKEKSKKRILFCAPSNTAVDEVTSRLILSPPWRDDMPNHDLRKKLGNCGDFNLIRVGRRSRLSVHVVQYSLDFLLEAKMKEFKAANNCERILEEMKEQGEKLNALNELCNKYKLNRTLAKEYIHTRDKRAHAQMILEKLTCKLKEMKRSRVDWMETESKFKRQLLLSADIICCTLNGAGSKIMTETFKRVVRHDVPFACVIIDEAGQCTEPDAIIPLQYGASKLILVGDPAQLPATVLSHTAQRFNYGQSLFERLYRGLLHNNKGEAPSIMLNLQYRMAPDICYFPAKRFYNNELRSAKETVINANKSTLSNYVMLNVVEGREIKTSNGSVHNPTERQFIVATCEAILAKKLVGKLDVGVMAPYKEQVFRLRQDFLKKGLPAIDIKSVDGYQGQEKRVIILSCVRSTNITKTIGFLVNPQRMNVALTRSKESLIVFGNCSYLEQVDDNWKALVEDARDRGVFFDVRCEDDIFRHILKKERVNSAQHCNQKKGTVKTDLVTKNFRQQSVVSIDRTLLATKRKAVSMNEGSSVSVELNSNNKRRLNDLCSKFPYRAKVENDTGMHLAVRKPPQNSVCRTRPDNLVLAREASSSKKRRLGALSNKLPNKKVDNGTDASKTARILNVNNNVDESETESKTAGGEIQLSSALLQKRLERSTNRVEQGKLKELLKTLDELQSNVVLSSKDAKPSVVSPCLSSPTLLSPSTEGWKTSAHGNVAASIETNREKRRSAPSSSYYKLPHRHGDGTLCERVCARLLVREHMRSTSCEDHSRGDTTG